MDSSAKARHAGAAPSTRLASLTNKSCTILQWNARSLQNKRAELALRLRENHIPILALCEGALPGTTSLPGYIKYTNPNLPTFPH